MRGRNQMIERAMASRRPHIGSVGTPSRSPWLRARRRGLRVSSSGMTVDAYGWLSRSGGERAGHRPWTDATARRRRSLGRIPAPWPTARPLGVMHRSRPSSGAPPRQALSHRQAIAPTSRHARTLRAIRSADAPSGTPRAAGAAADARIPLRGRELHVAEQLLDGAEVGAPLEQVRGERVSQRVRANPESRTAARDVARDEPRHASTRQPRPAGIHK